VVDGLHDLGALRSIPLDVYLPCETRWNRLARVKVPKDVPMLPGYLFLNIEPEHLWRVDKLDGVYQILGWSRKESVREALHLAGFVSELRAAQAAGAFDRTQTEVSRRPKFTKGEKVRITSGQFSGFIGEIVERRGNDRVRVLLSIFGRVGPALIPAKDLETPDDASKEAA
jgi:transcription antitermination factor NusG